MGISKMAEPVSAIVSLATVSLEIIKRLAKFIKEAKAIDKTIESLLVQLIDFKDHIKLVSSTCRQSPLGERSQPHRYIRSYLSRSQVRLDAVESDVRQLASRPSRTFFHKVPLTIRAKHWRGRIDDSIKDLERLSRLMDTAVSLWTLQVTQELHHRQNSRTISAEEVVTIRARLLRELAELDQAQEPKPLTSVSRTDSSFSQTDTIFNPPSRRTSSVMQDPRASISSSSGSSESPQSRYGRNDSVISESIKPKNDWLEFHFQIVERHDSSEAQIQAIRDALQQHPDRSYLANFKDGSKRSPLHWAAQRGDLQLAQILVDVGADINAKDSQPCSVLDLAVAHNHEHFVSFLIRNGVDECAVSKQNQFRFDEMRDAIELRRNIRT